MPELRVPGATLYYERRGSGPVLLMIPGGGGDAASFDLVGADLADRFTVVAVDPRGKSRSAAGERGRDQRVEVHSDDMRRLLAEVSPTEPAFVFGSSSGAVIALDLLARHPERLRLVVAHEPPVLGLLPDADRWRAAFAGVVEAFGRDGLEAAMAALGAAAGQEGTDEPDDERDGAATSASNTDRFRRMRENMPQFLERELRQFSGHMPDVDALAAHSGRLVPACGRASRGLLLARPAAVLAGRFGIPLVEFPGGHVGLSTHPVRFAEVLRRTLAGAMAEDAAQPR
ncbi:alpha/beta fold hydrolase [Streptomyces sp. TLI_146]|uniref:alpha/beta fold hydrolase n=1 Tax=Streptomyces sp. TLI_146 TaxID=1938858 RepID=UPI000C701ECF|nr:alpha/beta hydrolase [Streptomyces sp. TLI_146]PKV84056.1 pimeloyl-ACP methyl ester carboxylesterase [Streptomyces sp. TLI_146]